MYQTKYQAGNEIVSRKGSLPSEVRGPTGELKYRGPEIECLRWLAQRGDKIAQRELATREEGR